MKCLITGHDAEPVRNRGLEFGHCRHCRRDLLRTNRRWRRVPRGFRVVWQRRPSAAERNAAQFELDLVAPGRALVPWDSRRALVARVRQAATGIGQVMGQWLSAPRGNAALMRMRARLYILLRPEREETCIRLPYRPLTSSF